jgi:hypothetical protein
MSEQSLGLDGQTSGQGGIRTADAAVAADRLGIDPTRTPLEGCTALDRTTASLLVGVARALYPHDRLPDVHYERVVAALDIKAAEDERLRALLTEGVGWLATTTGRHPQEFAGLPEREQVAALTRLQDTPFVKAIAAEVVVNLYSQHDVWPYFGYEGPSNDQGGYLHRGFDDIDWLDDAPDYRDQPVAERIGSERHGDEARIDTRGAGR